MRGAELEWLATCERAHAARVLAARACPALKAGRRIAKRGFLARLFSL